MGKVLTGRALQRRLDLACGIMFFLYGYDAGVLGGVLETPQFLDSLGNPTGTYDIPMIASSYTLAAFFATPLVMVFGWWFGRKRTLLLGCLTVVIGAAIQASAYSVAHIIVGRIVCGFGIGFISTTVPVYQNEMSQDKDTRGRKMAITCAFLIAGIPTAYWFDYGMSFIKHSISWRLPIAAQAFPAILSGCLFLSCPDTPRWYYGRGRMEEGDRVLERVWDRPLKDPLVAAEKRGIFVAIELEHTTKKPRFVDFIWDRTELKVARRLIICFLVLSFQQLMSINFLVYYSTIIFRQNGLDANMSAILGAVLNTVFFLGTLPAIFMIDSVGRRGLMLYSAMIMTVIMTVFVALLNIPNPTNASNWAASALIIIYILFYGTGWMGAAWQYAPEIAPLELRHVGASLNASGEWLWSFVTVFASPIALADPKVGPKIWFWYLAFNVLAIPFVYYCCPETAGQNLEELDVLYCKDEGVKRRLLQERQEAYDAAEAKAIRQAGLDEPKSTDVFTGKAERDELA